jgi:hypothetical protein
MAFAAPPDVAARLGRSLTADETTQVEALLEDAEAMILKRVPDLQARVTAGTLTTATIVRIESNSVRRVMVNPTGIRSHSEGLGDFQQSDTFDSSISTGELYVDDNAWADLAGTPESCAFTINPAYAATYGTSPFCRPWLNYPYAQWTVISGPGYSNDDPYSGNFQ